VEPAPGTLTKPSRFVPRFHWELLACGVAGHELIGTDARTIRPGDGLVVREADGLRWHRCLRCDSWLALLPPTAPTRDVPPDRSEVELPLRGKALRDKIVLRVIAVNRALHFLVLGLIAIALLVFAAHRSDVRGPVLRALTDLTGGATATGAGHAQHGIAHQVERLFTLQSNQLHLFAAVVGVYAVVEGIEAIGLWSARRWAEYLTFLVTASLLPIEVYEIVIHQSPLKITAFVVNVAVVLYLLFAKRLFGLRGGAKADEDERLRDMGWPALERNLPAGSSVPA
jgi:uncharacterized membrane protein (DUF2068 family)